MPMKTLDYNTNRTYTSVDNSYHSAKYSKR